ncbi:ATP-dependent Clp protease adapter protein ClpS [Planctomycetaceae bacterium]|nr:ATP-dependent Clp protease adapter protein ClpS [Planctomycetaceae bacterium]
MPDDVPTQRSDDEPDFSDMPTARAPDCALVFHDDAETPADFVLFLLERYCGLDEEQSRNVVQEMTTRGKAVAAVFPERIARVKLSQIEDAAKSKYPFKASLESIEA